MKTKVKFLIHGEGEQAELFAFFPFESYNDDPNLKTCYSHVGQHSACHIDYAAEAKRATPEEYKYLQKELTDLGYNLKVL